jgi:CheY-like chemotaxis protein
VAGLQRIFVVSTAATPDDLRQLGRSLGRSRLVLTAPTTEGKAVVTALGGGAQPEMLLAPVRFPPVDRGQQLDTLVRNHALQDRFTDVVAITDPASVTLLLRVMAPDQLPTAGAVTEVGLPRADRPADLRRGAIAGGVLGVLAVVGEPVLPILALPAVAGVVGLVLLVVPAWRYLAQEVLLLAVVSVAVAILLIASAQRFPA